MKRTGYAEQRAAAAATEALTCGEAGVTFTEK